MEDFDVDDLCQKAQWLCETVLGHTPGYGLEDLEVIEEAVQRLRSMDRKGLIDKTVEWNTSVVLGTYAGEIIRKNDLGEKGFSWQEDDYRGYPVLKSEDGHNAMSPISKVVKKIRCLEDGEDGEGTLMDFYKTFLLLLDYHGPED